jgi:predicted XRE-type DNA-binding protein
MARNWQRVRADTVERGHLDVQRVANARKALDDTVRAYRLAEVRKAQGATQADVAAAMHVSQVRVSKIERGELSRSELGTLQSYVEALGGHLSVVADFGDQKITVE